MHRNFTGYILMQGGLGVLPQELFDIRDFKGCILVLLWVALIKYPYPQPLQKIIIRFTLISRKVLGAGKKSEIRLKSEDFDPCLIFSVLCLSTSTQVGRECRITWTI